MSLAKPLEVPETEVVRLTLKNLQNQAASARALLAFLHGKKAAYDYTKVEEQLKQAEAHLQEAVNSMQSMPVQCPFEISPTIPWVAATPEAEGQGPDKTGASMTLRERGDILSKAVQARKLAHHSQISAEHDPICPSSSQQR